MNFRKLIIIVAMQCLLLFLSGCAQNPPTLTFAELFAKPESYNEKAIIIEGYFWQGWETIVFAEKLDYFLSSRRALAPGGRMMWVEGGISKEIYDRLYKQPGPAGKNASGKSKSLGCFVTAEVTATSEVSKRK